MAPDDVDLPPVSVGDQSAFATTLDIFFALSVATLCALVLVIAVTFLG